MSLFSWPRLRSWLPGLLIIAATVIALYGFFPYFEGYTDQRSAVSCWIYGEWHAYEGEWEHGMLVPWLVLLLVYLDRNRILATERRPSRWGWAVVAASCFCFWVGYAADVEYFGFAALYFLIGGLIICCGGWPLFRVLIFPWAFLAFMFPMPFLDNMLAFPLRTHMTRIAHVLLNFIGVTNDEVGTAIVSPPDPLFGLATGARFAVDVADPCSGIRSLFALMMLAALFGHLAVRGFWQKWALFLAAIPLALLGNVVRLIMLVLAFLWWGGPFAVGTNDHPSAFHEGAGFMVFIVAVLGMVLVSEALRRFAPGRPPPAPDPEAIARAQATSPRLFPLGPALGFVGLTLATALICWGTTPPALNSEAGLSLELPTQVGDWTGKELPVPEAERTILPADTGFAHMQYRTLAGDFLNCTIVLSGAERRSIHRPEICLPAQGLVLQTSRVIDIPLNAHKKMAVTLLDATRLVRTPSGEAINVPYCFMYWFVGNNITTAETKTRILLTSWDRVVHHINHRWAYVMVQAPVTASFMPSGKDHDATVAMMKQFIADSVPRFQKPSTLN